MFDFVDGLMRKRSMKTQKVGKFDLVMLIASVVGKLGIGFLLGYIIL